VRRLAALATLVVLALGLGGAHAYADGGADNVAVAINTKDGSSVFKFAFAIRHVMQDTVDTTNAAVAYSSCTSCDTTAIAIEIVLVEGDPSVFTPTNMAIAINEECNLCITFASAYQFTFQSSGPVHFNAEGNKAIEDIKKEIKDLENQTLTVDELRAKLDDLMKRLADVIANDLVPAGNSGEDHGNASDNGGTAATPTTSTATTTEPTTTTVDTTTTPTTPTDTTSTTPTTTGETTTGTTTTTP
jgi:putative peptide zinc metalloprotease protein